MSSSFKKAIIIAICAVLLVSAVVPALAVTGTENHSHIEYTLGIRVSCYSELTVIHAKSDLTLSFEKNVDHMPEQDYYCRVVARISYTDNTYSEDGTVDLNAMSASITKLRDMSKTVLSSNHRYYVNVTHEVHNKTFS